MRQLAEQPFSFVQGFPYQANFRVFQVAQPAVDDPCGPAGGAGGKIILLNQQRAFAPLCAFTRNGNTVDTAADDQNVKILVLIWDWAAHAYVLFRCFFRSTATLLPNITARKDGPSGERLAFKR